jgi:hypothetical protein
MKFMKTRTKHRIFSMFLAMVMVLSVFTVFPVSANAEADERLTWNIDAQNPEAPRSSNVSQVGPVGNGNRDGHVLKIDNIGLTLEDVPNILANNGGVIDFNFHITWDTSRRIVVWTDLSGEGAELEDFAFANSTNTGGDFPKAIRSASRLTNGDTSLRIFIPIHLLYDKENERVANQLYVIITTDSASDTAGNQRGNTARLGRDAEFNLLLPLTLSITPCDCGQQDCLDCATHIFPFPLDKDPSMIWEGGTMRGWENRDFDLPRFGTPPSPVSFSTAGARYMVFEFIEEPEDWGVRFQDNSWIVYELLNENFTKIELDSGMFRYIVDFGNGLQEDGEWCGDLPPSEPIGTATASHPGYTRSALYGTFQMVIQFDEAMEGAQNWDTFLSRLTTAYFTNHDPAGFPVLPETAIFERASMLPMVTGNPQNIVSVNTEDKEGLKLYYEYQAENIDAIRIQYSIDGLAFNNPEKQWINIHRSFSIIRTNTVTKGRRMEVLPREAYDAANLQVRWIPHGRWGENNWGDGALELTNVRLTHGLQVSDIPRASSPILGIASMTNQTVTVAQRGEGNIEAPAVRVRGSGGSTGVLWTSSDPSKARVINVDGGALIRGLTPKETEDGRIAVEVAAASDPSVYTEFYVKVEGINKKPPANINFEVISPYEGVDWDNYNQYKASLHNHTTQSDGQSSMLSAAARFYEQGYHIAAITDHSVTTPFPDRYGIASNGNPTSGPSTDSTHAGNPRKVIPNEIISKMEKNEAITVDVETLGWRERREANWFVSEETVEKIVTRSTNEGMFFVPGTNEHSSQHFAELTHAQSGHHVNTFWSFLPQIGSSSSPHSIRQLVNRLEAEGIGGLARINHPGRQTGSEWEMPWDEATRVANNSANFAPYANLFMESYNNIGTEIINKFDTETQAERVLWDNMLAMSMPEGNPIWGFSEDDAHSNNAIGFSWNVMLMPELSMPALRQSMYSGSFFAFSRVDRQYGLYPGSTGGATDAEGVPLESSDGLPGRIEPWDWDAGDRDDEPEKAKRVQPVIDRPVQEITSIDIEKDAQGNDISITINAQATKDGVTTIIDKSSVMHGTAPNRHPLYSINWYADGILIHQGKTLDLIEHQLSIYSYVRATVFHRHYGALYVQPFEILGGFDDNKRDFPNLEEVFEVEIDDIKVGTTKEELERIVLPAGVPVRTDQCVRECFGCPDDCTDCKFVKPHFATVKWDLSNYDAEKPSASDIMGTVILPTGVKKITNTKNIPLGVTSVINPPLPDVELKQIDLDWDIFGNICDCPPSVLPVEPTDEDGEVCTHSVFQIGAAPGHLLKLDIDIDEEDFFAMRGNRGGTVDITLRMAYDTARRMAVWTDLSKGSEAKDQIAFATTANIVNEQVFVTAGRLPEAPSADRTVSIEIPRDLLHDGENMAKHVYVIITVDGGPEGATNRYAGATDNRGATARAGMGLTREFDVLSKIELSINGAICCTEEDCSCNAKCNHVWGTNWTDVAGKAASCEKNGLRELVCSNAGCEVKKLQTVPMLGHTGEWTAATSPTCTQRGTEVRACGRAGCETTETRFRGQELGHELEWDEVSPVTCTERAKLKGSCTRDGCDFETDEVDGEAAPLQHIDRTPANCTVCALCGATDLGQTCAITLCTFHANPPQCQHPNRTPEDCTVCANPDCEETGLDRDCSTTPCGNPDHDVIECPHNNRTTADCTVCANPDCNQTGLNRTCSTTPCGNPEHLPVCAHNNRTTADCTVCANPACNQTGLNRTCSTTPCGNPSHATPCSHTNRKSADCRECADCIVTGLAQNCVEPNRCTFHQIPLNPFHKGDVTNTGRIEIGDVLEVLKLLARIKNNVLEQGFTRGGHVEPGGPGSRPWVAAQILPTSQATPETRPTIGDVLEMLKVLARIPTNLKQPVPPEPVPWT